MKEIKKKIKYTVLLVKPFYGCSTKEIYSTVRSYSSKKLEKNNVNYFRILTILDLKNDLEKIVFKEYPKLWAIKKYMLTLPNVLFVFLLH